MRISVTRVLRGVLFACATLPAALAQPAAPRPDPLDAQASVPPVTYRSPLAGFRPWAEQAVGSWREANETVNRIGGWRTYAREGQPAAPGPVPAAAAASAPKHTEPPKAAGHTGHRLP